MKKLTIAVVQQSPDIGGAETYMASLLEYFRSNHNTIFLATDSDKFLDITKSSSDKQMKIPFTLDIIGDWKGLVKTIFKFPFAIIFYFKLLHTCKKHQIDVILMSGFSEKMLVTFLAGFFQLPVVWIEYSPLDIVFRRNFYLPKIIYRLLCNKAYALIVPTESTKNALVKSAQVSLHKVHVIPCATSIPIQITKQKQLFSKDSFVIGNVSRLTSEKGQDILIKAMPQVLKQIPQAKLLIIGDGPDRKYYQELTNKLNLQNTVIITGFVDHLENYWREMDVFVFSSVWNLEGFGLVTIEAMARKIPVIANNIGPTPEISINNQTGLLIDISKQPELISALKKIYKEKNLRDLLAKNAFQKVKEKYDIKLVALEILDILSNSTIS